MDTLMSIIDDFTFSLFSNRENTENIMTKSVLKRSFQKNKRENEERSEVQKRDNKILINLLTTYTLVVSIKDSTSSVRHLNRLNLRSIYEQNIEIYLTNIRRTLLSSIEDRRKITRSSEPGRDTETILKCVPTNHLSTYYLIKPNRDLITRQ